MDIVTFEIKILGEDFLRFYRIQHRGANIEITIPLNKDVFDSRNIKNPETQKVHDYLKEMREVKEVTRPSSLSAKANRRTLGFFGEGTINTFYELEDVTFKFRNIHYKRFLKEVKANGKWYGSFFSELFRDFRAAHIFISNRDIKKSSTKDAARDVGMNEDEFIAFIDDMVLLGFAGINFEVKRGVDLNDVVDGEIDVEQFKLFSKWKPLELNPSKYTRVFDDGENLYTFDGTKGKMELGVMKDRTIDDVLTAYENVTDVLGKDKVKKHMVRLDNTTNEDYKKALRYSLFNEKLVPMKEV